MAKETPMMEQYKKIKAEYRDAFLFFRLGDFYELFFEDAKRAAEELEITLTSRGKGEDGVPMCGVPYHSSETYIAQLVDKGFKVAICEQTEDPQQAKGVVKREVVQLVTPGTVMQGRAVQEKENNYMVSVDTFDDDTYSLAACDLTTGECKTTMVAEDLEAVIQEIASFSPREIVVSSEVDEELIEWCERRLQLTVSVQDETELPAEMSYVLSDIEQTKLRQVTARLIAYFVRTQKRSLDHIQKAQYYTTKQFMSIDPDSKRNLELTETIRGKSKRGSLLGLLDKTVTAMGGRALKQWVERPLMDEEALSFRLNVVEALLDDFFVRQSLQEDLKHVYDVERLTGKVAFGSVNAREFVQLRQTLAKVPPIFEQLNSHHSPAIRKLVEGIDMCQSLRHRLDESILDDPPVSITEGNLLKDGYHEQLDQYRDAMRNGKAWIASLEQQEREATGIKSLKVGFNKVFGYYIEVTKANLNQLPEGRYERKQTLTNAERYITPELKEKEQLIFEAEEKSGQLEYELFLQLREEVKQYMKSLQQLAQTLATIDVLQSFAKLSDENRYVRPQFSQNRDVKITAGRHPVVEQSIDIGSYVANDVFMNEKRDMLLITGPNMAGKSTYMRQLALISVMAQIGCFVPADEAHLPKFDQIFTRIGAADDVAHGQSTFMVEMVETNRAVSKATEQSLILLDEIGRGTSTYDGMALAQAIVEHIHHDVGAKTLFSTHYHELTTLETELARLKNVHVSATEEDGKVVFLHRVIEGAADRSYGVYVAELADLPKNVIERAKTILSTLESQTQDADQSGQVKELIASHEPKEETEQLPLFQIEEEPQSSNVKEEPECAFEQIEPDVDEQDVLATIKNCDVLNMTPLQAIETLNQMKQKLGHK
ncbi:DNA mismatch repair protein MutS [Texcoconibacillus texcoconensis]|uniref:DNA mismatch repair protein MutS n=1 Tax=Texcoconibacillus texcoconensis TaxID=1095777 RepID=A0A840QCE7_9BACI|nr:DNA mismatch repair protein MutS [Texcoconibacillus texcoconensis]MBB5171990.1 DNA mismatch repair protein MutS [Texcoconibacillus texcoconensis]